MAGRRGATKSPIAKVLDQFYLIVDPNEESLGKWLATEGFWEAWITAWCTENVMPGDVVCDLGANYGYFTRLFESLAGPTGYVYAVEANPSLANLLGESISKYPSPNAAPIEVLNIAAMDKRCIVTLNIPTLLGGASVVGHPEGSHSVEVQGYALDELLDRKVDVFKIDIEGAEPFAMAGMKKLLRNCRCCVVEVGNYHPSDFLQSLFEEFQVTKINFIGKEEKYSLEKLRSEPDFVMLVLRAKEVKSWLDIILAQLSAIKNKFLGSILTLIAKVIKKLYKSIS